MDIKARTVPETVTKSCGSCSLCCKLLSVSELNKPIDTWCPHARPGKGGCAIYPDRPHRCRVFVCGWLQNSSPLLVGRRGHIGVAFAYDDAWYPARCKMVLFQAEFGKLVVAVDPNFPNAWRHEPYYSQLRAAPLQVVIRIGRRVIELGKDGSEHETIKSQADIEGRDEEEDDEQAIFQDEAHQDDPR